MKILFRNVTAVTMDPARPVLQNACVAVEGTDRLCGGRSIPRGGLDGGLEGEGRLCCPAWSTATPMCLWPCSGAMAGVTTFSTG